MRVWNLFEPSSTPVVVPHPDIVRALAFSPDGLRLASACDDGAVRLWDAGDLRAEPTLLRGHDDRIWSIAMSRDRKLATASDDKSVRIYELTPGPTAPKVLQGHLGPVKAVTFGADDQTLASGSDDKTVRVWKLEETAVPPAVLKGHEYAVLSVAIRSDGRHSRLLMKTGSYGYGACSIWMLLPSSFPILVASPLPSVPIDRNWRPRATRRCAFGICRISSHRLLS